MKEFKLLLNNPPNDVYYPGMTVTGTVLVVNDKPKSYKAILVTIFGQVHVHRGSQHEDFLNTIVCVWEDKDKSREFPVGEYQFPFSLQLVGNNLPASFESRVGYIRYTLEARVLKNSFMKSDTVCTSRIKILNIIDVYRPDLFQPRSMEVHRTLGYLCCVGTIVITACIPRTGYYIEQDSIPVQVSVENGSGSEIEDIYIHINKLVHYADKVSSHYIATVCGHSVGPHRTDVWEAPPIAIPDTPATSINSRILKVKYSLQVQAAVSFIWTDDSALKVIPTIDIPLVLATVPPDPPPQPIAPFLQQGLEPSAQWPGAMPFSQPFQPQPGCIPYSMPQSFPSPKSSIHIDPPPPNYEDVISFPPDLSAPSKSYEQNY